MVAPAPAAYVAPSLTAAAALTTTAEAQSAATLGTSAPAAASGDSNTVTNAATYAVNGAAASSVNAATATVSLAQPTATAATATTNASSANTASAASLGALTVAAQLQTLNSSLAALGLSPSDIQKVDHIAGLINGFNPTSFTSLVYQLEALAQNAAPQTTQTPAASDSKASAAVGPQTRRYSGNYCSYQRRGRGCNECKQRQLRAPESATATNVGQRQRKNGSGAEHKCELGAGSDQGGDGVEHAANGARQRNTAGEAGS